MDKRKTRRAAFYFKDTTPYITVTNVLKVIDKPALRYWYGKQVYIAVTKDPEISEQEALAAPYKTMKKAQERGTSVHTIAELHTTAGKLSDDHIDENLRPYAHAYYQWFDDIKPTVVHDEMTVYSNKHGYAGTMDKIVHFGKEDELSIIDIKTGKDIYYEVDLQLSAYKEAAVESGFPIVNCYTLLLGESGKYKFAPYEPKLEVFLAAKNMYQDMNKETLEKYGYFDAWKEVLKNE